MAPRATILLTCVSQGGREKGRVPELWDHSPAADVGLRRLPAAHALLSPLCDACSCPVHVVCPLTGDKQIGSKAAAGYLRRPAKAPGCVHLPPPRHQPSVRAEPRGAQARQA